MLFSLTSYFHFPYQCRWWICCHNVNKGHFNLYRKSHLVTWKFLTVCSLKILNYEIILQRSDFWASDSLFKIYFNIFKLSRNPPAIFKCKYLLKFSLNCELIFTSNSFVWNWRSVLPLRSTDVFHESELF